MYPDWTDRPFNCGGSPVESNIKKNLVLILNNKRYNPQDFIDIGAKVARKAGDIEVYAVAAGSPSSILEARAWQRPTLTVAFSTAGAFSPVRGPLLIGRRIEKLDQSEALKQAGVSVPPVRLFEPGMKLDPSIWGDYVLLKPVPLEASSHGGRHSALPVIAAGENDPCGFPSASPGTQTSNDGTEVHRYGRVSLQIPCSHALR